MHWYWGLGPWLFQRQDSQGHKESTNTFPSAILILHPTFYHCLLTVFQFLFSTCTLQSPNQSAIVLILRWRWVQSGWLPNAPSVRRITSGGRLGFRRGIFYYGAQTVLYSHSRSSSCALHPESWALGIWCLSGSKRGSLYLWLLA